MTSADKLSFAPGIWFMLAVSLIITASFALLSYLNQVRQRAIVDQYTQETNQYITANTDGLNQVFSTIFDQAEVCLNRLYPNVSDCQSAVSHSITRAIADDLKDFSSTAFVKLINQSDLHLLFLSGRITTSPSNASLQKDVTSLLEGKTNQIPWKNYFWDFSGEEVVIPVDINGQRLGAIVRRVIE